MTNTLGNEYIDFLGQIGLLQNFLEFLLEANKVFSAAPDEPLTSPLLLELRADLIREKVNDKLQYTFGEEKTNTAKVFTSEDGSQLYVMRSEAP